MVHAISGANSILTIVAEGSISTLGAHIWPRPIDIIIIWTNSKSTHTFGALYLIFPYFGWFFMIQKLAIAIH